MGNVRFHPLSKIYGLKKGSGHFLDSKLWATLYITSGNIFILEDVLHARNYIAYLVIYEGKEHSDVKSF